MSAARARKPGANRYDAPERDEEDMSKTKLRNRNHDIDVEEPNMWILVGLFASAAMLIGLLFYYRIDNTNNGAFAQWVNKRFPALDGLVSKKPEQCHFGAAAQATSSQIFLSEEELKAYDGSDSETPIYLAINGTIFDVSASPAFYGPGGHYHHFVGKDATRAWVTECWDEPEQFTWRMDDVEVMFMPKYLDEMSEEVAAGNTDLMDEDDGDSVKRLPQEAMQMMAQKAIEKLGKVSAKEKAKRRAEDKKAAEAKVQDTLAHWLGFFSGNAKYYAVGQVILDESRPAPPAPCPAAMKKRELKTGKLEGMMGSLGSMPGMPDSVKNAMKPEGAPPVEQTDDGLYHEEL